MRAHHRATKHHPQRTAEGPGWLDWENQPDPFRRWAGAPLVRLDEVPPTDEPRYAEAWIEGSVAPRPLDRAWVSQLFYDSLALSAWKSIPGARWSLRVNPSSGNLHPTEGYLVAGPIAGLSDEPAVWHYAPREHALERRAAVPLGAWLALGLPPDAVLVGLSSIPWREAWKYGQRAWRYCQHDVGHAIGAVALAAAALGWRATLVDELASEEVATLLGLRGFGDAEAEEPDLVLCVHRDAAPIERPSEEAVARFADLAWEGTPNRLSAEHVEWEWVEIAGETCAKPATAWDRAPAERARAALDPMPVVDEPIPFRRVVRGRRSAVAMDGRTGLAADGFFQALRRTLPARGQHPFGALPWRPEVDLALFVHRVAGVEPGLYVLLRDPERLGLWRGATRSDFEWARVGGAPAELPLFRLRAADVRGVAASVSCAQAIAGDGAFSLGMVARFEESLAERGAWSYPRLFWECGLVGQVLYLEAEALGLRSTGIGCFFDDAVHALLGIGDLSLQSLYHFTVGGPVEDERLTTEPAYPREHPGA